MSRSEILLVEDNPEAREALVLLLEHHGYSVRSAENGAVALDDAIRQAPDLVITDLDIPELSGLELIQQFRQTPALADVPVIIVSGHRDIAQRVEGIERGADDYLSKPVHPDELLARVRRQLLRSAREHEVVRKSMVDALTGVLNRSGLANFFARELERSQANGKTVAVILADLNEFKLVNDSWGHSAGDRALCSVSRALQDALRANDRVGRMGGDEFAVVLADVQSDDCAQLVQRVRQISPLVIEAAPHICLRLGISVGLGIAGPGEKFAAVLDRADLKMYEDKRRQKLARDSLC